MDTPLIKAHRFCTHNRIQLEQDGICGCFYCLRIFHPAEIKSWLAVENTALCPYCCIDSVIGESSGYPITPEFLQQMHDYWF